MKKVFLLTVATVAMSAASIADPVLPQGMEILTPAGVEVTTNSERAYDKDKPLTVAGSKTKGYLVYFTAKEEAHGEELWVSDGTVAGTKMVKDIYPGAISSNVSYITRFNDKVVFSATGNDDDGAELWISDGTEEGTYMLKDINLLGSSEPKGFTQLDETRFVFAAKDFESETYGDDPQYWLWISDGTEEGTQLLKDCSMKYPGQMKNNDEVHYRRVGRTVYFKADTKDNLFGEELWITDGTTEGTKMLMDINTKVIDEVTGATAGAQIDWMTNFHNKKLFFVSYSEDWGREPWITDGTTEGTHLIADMVEGLDANGSPRGAGAYTPRVYGEHVYFRGNDPVYGMELFKTDFTREGTVMVADLNKNPTTTGTDSGQPDLFCEYDGVLFLKAATGGNAASTDPINYGLELFYTDGTTEGTKMQSDLNPGVGPNAAWEGIVISGSFFFRAQDQTPPAGGSQFWELFSMDSKDEFPHKVVDLGDGPDFVHSLRNVNGDLFFTSTIIKSLFKYHYRKPNYDPEKDTEEMDIDFGEGGNAIQTAKSDAASISFFPNPARNLITIVSANGVKGYAISDLSGRRVAAGANATTVPLNLEKGIYILTITDGAKELKQKLIVE
ncbi:MAG: T9SS type A sorting domain-containing protein [Prevotella sp.]|jgi:ELWxxDGT repeat protein|nr:T9SS type A sorting domain-containing protein [Prevotella sp.]